MKLLTQPSSTYDCSIDSSSTGDFNGQERNRSSDLITQMGDLLQTGCNRNGRRCEGNGKSDDSFSFSMHRRNGTEMNSEEIVRRSFSSKQARLCDRQGFKFNESPSNLKRDAADICLADDLFLNGQLIPFRSCSNPRIQYYMGDGFSDPFIRFESPNTMNLNSCMRDSQGRDTSLYTCVSSNRSFHHSDQFPKDVSIHHLGSLSDHESTAFPLEKDSSCLKVNEIKSQDAQDATLKHMPRHSLSYAPVKLSRCSSFKWNIISLKPLDPVHARLDDSHVRSRSFSASFSERSNRQASSLHRRSPRLLSSPNQRKSNSTLHHEPKKRNDCKENEHPKPKPELQDQSQSRIEEKLETNDQRNSKPKASGYLQTFLILKSLYEFLFWKEEGAEVRNSRLISGHDTAASCTDHRRQRGAMNLPACTNQKEEQNNAGIRAAIEHCKQSHGGGGYNVWAQTHGIS